MDTTVHLGDLLTLFIFGLSVYGMHKANLQRMDRMGTKVDLLYRWFQHHIIMGGRKVSFKDDSDAE